MQAAGAQVGRIGAARLHLRNTDQSAKLVVSTDQGRTWAVRGGCNVPVADRAFDEHMVIERTDGSLWLLARTRYGIGESLSTDRGATWPGLKPSAIAHCSARFFITRLSSGVLLLVKHGPIGKKTDRSHLTAYLSQDDGRTWNEGLLLDERDGVSYPDGQQTADGLVRIIYDYSRTGVRHILMATFREEDVAAGRAVSGAVRLRQRVSKASGGVWPEPPPTAANQDGEPLRKATPARWPRKARRHSRWPSTKYCSPTAATCSASCPMRSRERISCAST